MRWTIDLVQHVPRGLADGGAASPRGECGRRLVALLLMFLIGGVSQRRGEARNLKSPQVKT
jgi:hypothetical protein